MKNGRENRTNGNQEKGKEEKEALRRQYEVKGGRQKRPPKFLCGSSGCEVLGAAGGQSSGCFVIFGMFGATFGACFSLAGHNPRNAQKLQ